MTRVNRSKIESPKRHSPQVRAVPHVGGCQHVARDDLAAPPPRHPREDSQARCPLHEGVHDVRSE